MNILTGECKVKKILDANSDVLGDLTGVKATSTTPFSFQGSKRIIGKNLFDKENANITNAFPDQNTGELKIVSNYGDNAKSVIIPIEPNTQYVAQIDSAAYIFFRIAEFSSYPIVGDIGNILSTVSIGTVNRHTYTRFTTSSTAAYIVWYFSWAATESELQNKLDTMMLFKGTEVSEYEPYSPPIKNIFNKNSADIITNRIPQNITGKIVSDSTNPGSIVLPIVGGKKYTLLKERVTGRFRVCTYTNYPNLNEESLSFWDAGTAKGRVMSYTFTAPKNSNYLMWFFYTGTETVDQNQTIEDVLEDMKVIECNLPISKNLFNEIYSPSPTAEITYMPLYVGEGTFTLSSDIPLNSESYANLFFLKGNTTSGASTGTVGVWNGNPVTKESENGYVTIAYRTYNGSQPALSPANYHVMLEKGSSASSYEPYTILSNKLKLVDYSITGASGGVGDNRNLFDKNNPDLVNLYPNLDTGTVMDGSGYDAYSLIIPITSGSYIFQIYHVEGTLVRNRCRCACYSTYPQVGTTALSVDDTTSRRNDIIYNSFYAPEGTQYLMVFLWSGTSYTSTVINSVIANNNIMVGRGTGLTLNEYAAYEESYDIPIIISGKNEIINTVSSQTYNGLTIIRNDDGSITVNGTASANTNFIITHDSHTFEVADYQEIEKEKYILSGSPIDGEVNKYLMSFRYTPSMGTTSSLARVPAGGSVIIDNTNGNYNTIAPYLSVWSGVTCNNVTFKPMLRKINTTDTYEPPFKQKVILSLEAPLGAGDTITLDDTNIDIPISDGLNTISFQTSVQPSEVTLYLNESGEKHANKIMDASNHTLVDLFPFENMHKVSYYSQDGSTLISKEYVPHGGNAIGSVAISKDSTAQYDFTFAGWSALTGQISSTPNVLENITADRNVYAAFSETVRTYTVYFYNYDNTLLQTVQNVPYGGSATYTEATPTKAGTSTKEYVFTGWSPSPNSISGDISCVAQYYELTQTITDTWEQIVANANDGTYANRYNIGDTKIIDLGTEGKVAMEIVALDTDLLATDNTKTAAITWISKELLATDHRMNPIREQGVQGTGSIGGWEYSEMRSYLKNTIKPLIPSNIRSGIKEVTKYSKAFDTSETEINNSITTDDVWIPSTLEMNVTGVETLGVSYSNKFIGSASRVKKSVDETIKKYWLRSAHDVTTFKIIGGDGVNYYDYARIDYGIALGFCIGETLPTELTGSINDSWDEIITNAENNTYSTKYSIGDTKCLDLGTEGKVLMEIVAFNSDILASDSTKKAAITWISKQLLDNTHRMNPTIDNNTQGTGAIGGWEYSDMRGYLNSTIKPLIPSNIRSAIKEVTKYSKIYDTSGSAVNNVSTDDEVWIPSAFETGFSDFETLGTSYTSKFIDNTSRIKHRVGKANLAYHLRSAHANYGFEFISTDGSHSYGNSHMEIGVALGFCIGTAPDYITDSWATISSKGEAGTAENYYAIGDCKPIELNGTMGTVTFDHETIYTYILGFNHNSTIEGNGITFGGFKTAATNGIDVVLCDSNYNTASTDGSKWFNPSHWGNYNYGGWKGSDMRYDILGSTNVQPSGYGSAPTTEKTGYDATSTCATNPVANTLMSCLPSDLRSVMKPMTKYTDNTGNSSNISTNVTSSIDYLPLLSEFEIQGVRTYANTYEQDKQAQYAYYSAGNSKVKYNHSSTSSAVAWWARSPCYTGSTSFCDVGSNGSAAASYVRASRGVAPIFLVGTPTYTVSFYNYDNTLLQTVTGVPYGGSATYTEATPTKEGYNFTGWSPSPTNIQADTACYAQFEQVADYITDSWETISNRGKAGTAQNYYSVGDCKPIELNGAMGTLEFDHETLYVYILGFNHNTAYENAGITFGGFKTAATDGVDIALIDSHYASNDTTDLKWFNMNHRQGSSMNGHNFGGWKGSDMRYDILGSTDTAPSGYGATATTSNVGYDASLTCATNPVANTLMSCLPSDLRAVMEPMTKYTDNAGNKSNVSGNVTASIDYLPLLAEYEIFGARSYANQYEQNKQAQYAYYADGNNSKVKYRHSSTGSTAFWWGRSPHYNNSYNFCFINLSGSASSSSSRYSCGIAPVFLVGTPQVTTYTVTYHSQDGQTVLSTEMVEEGHDCTYSTTPTKASDSSFNYVFVGWADSANQTSPTANATTNIQQDTDLYAAFSKAYKSDTISDSWEDIIANCGNGTYSSKYQVGDLKTIDVGSEGLVQMQIVAINTDLLASDNTQTAPITWISKQLLTTLKPMNTTSSNYKANWSNCTMRTYLRGTILPLLPQEVQSGIKEVTKYTNIRSGSTTYTTVSSTENIWLPSYREISNDAYSCETSGVQYTSIYTSNDATREKAKIDDPSDTIYWWTRSASENPDAGYANWFAAVFSNGTASYTGYYCDDSNGVAIGFCT